MIRFGSVFVLATLVLMTPMFASYSEASNDSEPFSISLTDDSGSELDGPLFDGVVFYFHTHTYANNVVEYRLMAMVTIPIVPSNVLITSGGGQFEVDVQIEGLSSFLADTGIIVTLESSDYEYTACLKNSPTDPYHSKFMDESGVALFDPNKSYKLSITTGDGYTSVDPPTEMQNIRITFNAVLATGHHLVVFESEGSIVESYVVHDNHKIDHLPSVSRSGYTLQGWFTADGRQITEGYIVTPEEGDVYAYAKWEPNPDSGFPIIIVIGGIGGALATAAILFILLKKKKGGEAQ